MTPRASSRRVASEILDVHSTTAASSLRAVSSSSAASVCRRVIVFRIRENSERDHAMAPATGGWFFGSGG